MKKHEGCDTMAKEDFPLGSVEQRLKEVLDRLKNDMGLYVVRGIPINKYTKAEMRMIYQGSGLDMGVALSQSGKGDVLGAVKTVATTSSQRRPPAVDTCLASTSASTPTVRV
jgi:hypothetical protein